MDKPTQAHFHAMAQTVAVSATNSVHDARPSDAPALSVLPQGQQMATGTSTATATATATTTGMTQHVQTQQEAQANEGFLWSRLLQAWPGWNNNNNNSNNNNSTNNNSNNNNNGNWSWEGMAASLPRVSIPNLPNVPNMMIPPPSLFSMAAHLIATYIRVNQTYQSQAHFYQNTSLPTAVSMGVSWIIDAAVTDKERRIIIDNTWNALQQQHQSASVSASALSSTVQNQNLSLPHNHNHNGNHQLLHQDSLSRYLKDVSWMKHHPQSVEAAVFAMLHYLSFAKASYAPTPQDAAASAAFDLENLVQAQWEAKRLVPAYYVAWDPAGASHWKAFDSIHMTLSTSTGGSEPSSKKFKDDPTGSLYEATSTTRTLVVAIRGTHSAEDALTNLHFTTTPFLGSHYAHDGIAQAASALYDELYPLLKNLATTHAIIIPDIHGSTRFNTASASASASVSVSYIPQVTLVIVGHSLGAAVAQSLTALVLHDPLVRSLQNVFVDVKCFAFCPPPALSPSLARADIVPQSRQLWRHIVSIVHGADIVPRLSARSVEAFITKSIHTARDPVQDSIQVLQRSLLNVFFNTAAHENSQSQPRAHAQGHTQPTSLANNNSSPAQSFLAFIADMFHSNNNNLSLRHHQRQTQGSMTTATSSRTSSDHQHSSAFPRASDSTTTAYQPFAPHPILVIPGRIFYIEKVDDSPVIITEANAFDFEDILPSMALVSDHVLENLEDSLGTLLTQMWND